MGRNVATLLFLAVITLSAGCSTLPALPVPRPVPSKSTTQPAQRLTRGWLHLTCRRRRTLNISLSLTMARSPTVYVSLMLQELVDGPWLGYSGDVGLTRVGTGGSPWAKLRSL